MHGSQVVCMKLTQTGLPRSAERSISPPPTWGTTSAGAASPTWKFSVTVEEPGEAADPDGPPDADGDGANEAEADAPGLAAPEPEGDGVGRTGSGPTSTKPASNAPAARRPASRPATIESRDPMRREGTSTSVPEALPTVR